MTKWVVRMNRLFQVFSNQEDANRVAKLCHFDPPIQVKEVEKVDVPLAKVIGRLGNFWYVEETNG